MCVIVDANMASQVFSRPPTVDGKPVIEWLLKREGLLVFGGKLTSELSRLRDAMRTLVELRRAGKAVDVESANPRAHAEQLAWCALRCRSNDAHVLAIARCSGARTLVTNDARAMDDFKDKDLLSNPRGKIYQRAEHASLLTHTQGCQRPDRERT
jgi:hypothetical protein